MSLFKTKTEDKRMQRLMEEIRDINHNHGMAIERIQHDRALELQQKDFDLKHFKDEELKKVNEEVVKLRGELNVAKKENEMLDKIVDVNADIVNVKELINSLIKKLPEVNLQNLTIQSTNSK